MHEYLTSTVNLHCTASTVKSMETMVWRADVLHVAHDLLEGDFANFKQVKLRFEERDHRFFFKYFLFGTL